MTLTRKQYRALQRNFDDAVATARARILHPDRDPETAAIDIRTIAQASRDPEAPHPADVFRDFLALGRQSPIAALERALPRGTRVARIPAPPAGHWTRPTLINTPPPPPDLATTRRNLLTNTLRNPNPAPGPHPDKHYPPHDTDNTMGEKFGAGSVSPRARARRGPVRRAVLSELVRLGRPFADIWRAFWRVETAWVGLIVTCLIAYAAFLIWMTWR
jgi:hypothetical protein